MMPPLFRLFQPILGDAAPHVTQETLYQCPAERVGYPTRSFPRSSARLMGQVTRSRHDGLHGKRLETPNQRSLVD